MLQAPCAATAATAWAAFCLGLQALYDSWSEHGSSAMPYFQGCDSEPSLAEAATAPALFHMTACLHAVRDLSLLPECEAMGLTRLTAWLTAGRPGTVWRRVRRDSPPGPHVVYVYMHVHVCIRVKYDRCPMQPARRPTSNMLAGRPPALEASL